MSMLSDLFRQRGRERKGEDAERYSRLYAVSWACSEELHDCHRPYDGELVNEADCRVWRNLCFRVLEADSIGLSLFYLIGNI